MLQIAQENVDDQLAGLCQRHVARNMRSQQQIGSIPQEVILGQGLGNGHIQRCAGQLARFEGIVQRLLINGRAATYIDHIGVLIHSLQNILIQNVLGVLGTGQAKGHHVGALDGLRQLIHGIGLIAPVGLGLNGAAHAANGGTHGLQPTAKVGADVAHANDGHRAVIDGADVADDFPAPIGNQRLIFRHPAHHHQKHADHVLGDGDTVSARGVGQHDFGRGEHTGLGVFVHTGEGALHPAQIGALSQQFGREHAKQDLAVLNVLQLHLIVVEEPGLIAQFADTFGNDLFPAVVVKRNVDGDGFAHVDSPLPTIFFRFAKI